VLATVKVWPIDTGERGNEGTTANLDGVCALPPMGLPSPERKSARCSGHRYS